MPQCVSDNINAIAVSPVADINPLHFDDSSTKCYTPICWLDIEFLRVYRQALALVHRLGRAIAFPKRLQVACDIASIIHELRMIQAIYTCECIVYISKKQTGHQL